MTDRGNRENVHMLKHLFLNRGDLSSGLLFILHRIKEKFTITRPSKRMIPVFFGLIIISTIIYISPLPHLLKNKMVTSMNSLPNRRLRPLTDQLTIVTAYFNLGPFHHGYENPRNNSHYRKWMTIFASIENPVIAFIEKESDFQFFSSIRSHFPEYLTQIVRVDRKNLRSFQMVKRIAEIYSHSQYPKYYPNTVSPTYSAAMHSKYEVLQLAITDNPFRTKYFCWLDIGLFKRLTFSKSLKDRSHLRTAPKFHLELPLNFSTDSVAYTEVFRRKPNITGKTIVFRNEVWVGGGYFVGEHSVLSRWVQEYENGVRDMLAHNLMSTDQQVIYHIFNTLSPITKIQTYEGDGRFDEWYHLAYASRIHSLHENSKFGAGERAKIFV